jgi:hypothetical protein
MIKVRIKRKKIPVNQAQMELSFQRPKQEDRNYHLGGRSFYFFDFDDNVAYLTTPIVIFNKETGIERTLSSGEWANYHHTIGKQGPFKDYFIDYDDEVGSFRYFRDQKHSFIDKMVRKKQTFLSDIEKALQQADYSWKAPSWNCFYHATYNYRPTSVITARGHQKETIQEGIDLIVKNGHLPHGPNYLSIYPVTNPQIRMNELKDPELKLSVADLKREAIRNSVETAIKQYGNNPHHRFGMSDDDPKNVELITEEMKSLKKVYPEMSFFVIQTFEDSYVKTEILEQRTKNSNTGKIPNPEANHPSQLNLF